jgi:hypothetical protein
MPTDRFACLVGGAGLLLVLLSMQRPWGAHLIGFGLATALLWRGTAGQARCAVLAAVVGVAAFVNFFAGAAAALAVAGLLFIRGKYLCAESSEQ